MMDQEEEKLRVLLPELNTAMTMNLIPLLDRYVHAYTRDTHLITLMQAAEHQYLLLFHYFLDLWAINFTIFFTSV